MEDSTNYSTSDLYYAAFLRVAGVKFIGTTPKDGRVLFTFENSEGIHELKREYFSRSAKIGALDYADEVRSMKAMVYAR